MIYCPVTQTHSLLVFTWACRQHAVGQFWGVLGGSHIHCRARGHGSASCIRQAAGFEAWPHHISAVWSWLMTSLPALLCASGDYPIQWWGRWAEVMLDRNSGKVLASTEHSLNVFVVTIVTPELDPSSCLPSLMRLHGQMSVCSLQFEVKVDPWEWNDTNWS